MIKVRRIVRLLQEVARHVEKPYRSFAVEDIGDARGTVMSFFTALSMEKMTTTSASIGAIATLLAARFVQFPLYWSIF